MTGPGKTIRKHDTSKPSGREGEPSGNDPYRQVFEFSPCPMWIFDERTLRFLAVNESAIRCYGWTREEFMDLTVKDIRPPEEIPRLMNTIQSLRGSSMASAGEWKHRRKDGSVFDVDVTISCIRFQGRAARVATLRDLTKQKKEEASLLLSESRLKSEAGALARLNGASARLWETQDLHRGLDEILAATIELLGADFGNVQLFDPLNQVLRIQAQRGFNRPFLDHFREVSTRDRSTCGRALRTGRRVIIEDVEKDAAYAPHRKVARAAGYQAVQSTPLLARDGRPLGMISTHFRSPHRPNALELQCLDLYARLAANFIERCEIEESLRQSEERFRAICENGPIGIALGSLDGRITFANEAFHRMLGYRDDELIGRNFRDFTFEEDLPAENRLIKEMLAGKRSHYLIEKRYLRKDGRPIWVTLATSVLSDSDGKPELGIAMAMDISAAKRAEEELHGLNATLEQRVGERTAALRESEAKYRQLHETLHDAFVTVDMKGRILEFNPAYRKMLGYTGAELRRMTYPELTPKRWHRFEAGIVRGQILPRGYSRVYQKEYRRKDGTIFPVELRTILIRDERGKPAGMWAIVRDITERKRVEAELLASQRLARSTVEAIPAMVCVLDSDGNLIDTNEAWRSFIRTNGPKSGKTGTRSIYIEVFEQLPGVERKDAERFATGVRAVASARRKSFSMEYVCRLPAGNRWFTVHVSPFTGPGDRHMVVAHTDITPVKLAEERFRTVVESAPDAMVIVDGKGVIRIANEQAETLFGFPREELTGTKVEKLMPAPLRRSHVEDREKFAETPSTRPMGRGREVLARRKDGSEFPAEISLSPLETVGGRWVCAVVRDISERRRIEQAIRDLNEKLEQRVVERTKRLRVLNADLRKQVAERMRLEKEILHIAEAEQQRIGQDLHDDLGQRLAGARLLGDFLGKKLTEEGSGQAPLAAKVNDLLKDALARSRSLARGLQPVAVDGGGLPGALAELAERVKEIFGIRCTSGCPAELEVNETAANHLYRIAQEAVTNAVKHGKAGNVSITVSNDDPRSIVLEVEDDGAGISAGEGGKGIGLRIMRSRADLMRGTLDVRNHPVHAGCIVTCRIPVQGAPLPTGKRRK